MGFSEPISVWTQGRNNYILNGHQRLKVLIDMQSDGWVVPPVPVVHVKAKNVKEAKEKLLALTSQYGITTIKGLRSYTADAEINIEDVAKRFRIPDVQAEIDKVTGGSADKRGKMEFTEEVLEEHNYVVFFFDNTIDWGVVKQEFGIQAVSAMDDPKNYKNGYRRVGVGRVLNGKKLLAIIKKANDEDNTSK